MKKRLLSTLLCVVLVSVLVAGCGKSDKNTNTTPAPTKKATEAATKTPDAEKTPAAEQVTITYSVWDANQAKLLKTVADEFTAKNPNIKIDIQVTSWDTYWTALEAAATGGSLPDTFWMHTNNIYYYGSNDQLLDLTPYIEKSELVDLKNYPQGLDDIYNINGKQCAIPKDYDTIGLWYNKTLFDKAGIAYPDETWTWDTLEEVAKKLTTPDGKQYGFCAGLHNQEGYYNFVYQNGGEIITADKKSGYDNEKTIAGIQEYFDFVKNGTSPMIFDDAARSEAIQNGLVAMGMFGSWNLSAFAANEFMTKNFDVAILPSSPDGTRASIFNGLGNAIAANCKHPDEAWKWVEYLSSKEGQERQAELGIAISAYNGTADKFTSAYPMFNAKCYIDMVDYAKIRPYSNQTTVWEDKSYELLKKAYAGEEDTATACKAVAKMMNEALAAEQ